jgi:hypothetical protein
MAQTFSKSVRKDRSKGQSASRSMSLLVVFASLCRIGARAINSWSMEVYSDLVSPKGGSSSLGGGLRTC